MRSRQLQPAVGRQPVIRIEHVAQSLTPEGFSALPQEVPSLRAIERASRE